MIMRWFVLLSLCMMSNAVLPKNLPIAMTFLSKSKNSKPTELVYFYDPSNPLCKEMEPANRKIERTLKKSIIRFNIAQSRNKELLDHLDQHIGKCKSTPYYYNRETHQAICGPTTYANLNAWAKGLKSEYRKPPRLSKEHAAKVVPPSTRNTGLIARIEKRWARST